MPHLDPSLDERGFRAHERGGRAPLDRPINVFVHLARDKDAVAWRLAHASGRLVGVNDDTPYGYGRAEHMGCRVTFSRSAPENALIRFVRLALRAIAGFDYIHARRQGRALATADIIWTHTESQFLAVAAVLATRKTRPKLLGQSVWLFDRWPRLTPLHKAAYRRLIDKVDILTVLSDRNVKIARTLFPHKRVALVRFGIPCEVVTPPVLRAAMPIRVLSLGNDRHRDWRVLVEAVRGHPDMSLVILSGTADPAIARGASNVAIGLAKTNADLAAQFAKATMVCVPLKPNDHASGVTVIQEAALAGVPVIATDVGGLTSYFERDEVRYVAAGDPSALRAAIRAMASDPVGARAMAGRAQARMSNGSLSAESFVRQHVELSQEMLEA